MCLSNLIKPFTQSHNDNFYIIGKWAIETPSNVVLDNDLGLVVKDASAHHAIAAQLSKPFYFDGKPLIVQLVKKIFF